MGPSAPPAQKKRVTGGKPVHKRPGKENYQPYYVPADRASSGFPSISSAICYSKQTLTHHLRPGQSHIHGRRTCLDPRAHYLSGGDAMLNQCAPGSVKGRSTSSRLLVHLVPCSPQLLDLSRLLPPAPS
ncbi:hypothetical protein HBI56_069090 [Parastagonospora nodorum]|nr:hypothetical protein HBH42_129940 [Parastagonospora nodorum]KAH4348363.1 hypothetical protein HBH98_080000 [Parastagonospora nodorum]KAH4502335.1 hypothetical protein HBH89_105980 [Parastagonospora nodorum]KAH4535625.1 hypothetical protein HBH85_156760 [Parastagonospora nodorum]KAH4855021.1 hypothetical protein HBH75_090620 [Parastagonospora nodorum]